MKPSEIKFRKSDIDIELAKEYFCKPQHGVWIPYHGAHLCSECANPAPHNLPWKKCPFCGAVMKIDKRYEENGNLS